MATYSLQLLHRIELPGYQTKEGFSVMENRLQATERLRREGRWEEASAFKEVQRQALRAQGTPRSKANDQAWVNTIEKFSPSPLAEGSLDSADPQGFDEAEIERLMLRADGAATDLTRDVEWAYANAENKAVRPGDAPSPGAWSMLQFAKRDPGKFYSQLLPKVATPNKRADDKQVDPALTMVRGLIDDFIDGLRQDLLDDTPAAVQREARHLVKGWKELHGAGVSSEAAEQLEESIMELVNRCVRAVSEIPGAKSSPTLHTAAFPSN
jgi:hypothetical protein